MTTPPSASPPWLTRRRLALAVPGLLLAAFLAIRAFWWPAIIAPPAVDLAGVDPAVRRLVEERLEEVRKQPRSAEAWGTLAMALNSNRFTEQGQICLAQAERLDTTDPRWPHLQGFAYLSSDPDAALPKFQRATQLSGDANPASRLRLAELYLRLGRFDQAREQFEILLEKGDAILPPAHLGLARLDFHAGKLAQSRRHLRIPLNNPLTAKSALRLSAEIHAREGNATAARRDLAASSEIPTRPDWPDPFTREAQKYTVGQAALVQKAEMLVDSQRPAEAIKLLEHIVREYPNSRASWALLGWAQIQQGRYAEAGKALQMAIQIDPDSAQPLMYMGIVRINLKDRTGAKDYFRRAIDKKSDLFEAHFNLGQCLKEEGDRPGAIDELRTAVRCQPFSARAHALLGDLLLDDNRLDDAAFHLQEAVALNPDLQDAHKRLEDLQQKKAKAKKSS